ncbi:hypothetical protein EV426DRAFT_211732 [Tirmania nivea]|nr:hypothetical protein EV426DRAFT_211732 [Tirmania nivea]
MFIDFNLTIILLSFLHTAFTIVLGLHAMNSDRCSPNLSLSILHRFLCYAFTPFLHTQNLNAILAVIGGKSRAGNSGYKRRNCARRLWKWWKKLKVNGAESCGGIW